MTKHSIGQAAAREVAEQLALAADALPTLLAYIDTDARYAWVNEGYRLWFGRAPEEIIGRHPSELLDPGWWAVVQPYVDRVLGGEAVTFDDQAILHDRARDLRVAFIPDHDGSASVRGFVVFASDVSDLKAFETALRRSERMLEQSQATAQVGAWEVTLDNLTLLDVPGTAVWSRETYRIFGYEPDTQPSLALYYQRVHPDDRRDLQARSTLAVERAEAFETEYRIVLPDDSVRYIHAWLDFDRAPGDDTTRAFGTCQDVTERKTAAIEIGRAREQLQTVVDATPAHVARYDRERRVIWANKSYAARFGETPNELVGRRLVDLIGESAYGVIDAFSARVLAGESIQVELEVPYSGDPRFMQMMAAPTYDVSRAVDGCVVVLTDLTHRRKLEQERERALNEVRDADRRKEEFLAMLSHELRNPLAPILNAVEVLNLLGPEQDERAAEVRRIITRQSRHLKRLLDDLLDASRVSHGKIQLHKERLDLRTAIEQALEANRPMISERRQALSLELAPESMTVNADAARIVQVFSNLINNAAKYTDPEGDITISASVDRDEAVVTVRDNGVGMTPELLARAFDLFVQETRAPDRVQGGLGIGLTLALNLVTMHGGSIRATSNGIGQGSELVVRLPLAQPDEPSIASRAPIRAAAETPLRALDRR